MSMHPTFKARPGRSHVSVAGYLAMLAAVKRNRGTADDMIAAIKRPKTNALRWVVAMMHQLGMISVTSWVSPSGRGKLKPRFKFGPDDDAPYPGKAGHEFGSHKRRVGIEMVALSHFLDALWTGANTSQLVEATGWSRGTVHRAIIVSRKLKLARISEYDRRQGIGGSPTPIYAINLDSQPDAIRPERKSHQVLGREYRERNRIRRRLVENGKLMRPAPAANQGLIAEAA